MSLSWKIGSKENLNGGAWVSCCTEMIELELEDVAMNKLRLVVGQSDGLQWKIVAPVVIVIGSTVILLVTSVTVCTCRRRYGRVNTQNV